MELYDAEFLISHTVQRSVIPLLEEILDVCVRSLFAETIHISREKC